MQPDTTSHAATPYLTSFTISNKMKTFYLASGRRMSRALAIKRLVARKRRQIAEAPRHWAHDALVSYREHLVKLNTQGLRVEYDFTFGDWQ